MLSWFKRKLKKEESTPESTPVEDSIEDDSSSLESEDSLSTSPTVEEELAEDLFFEVPAADDEQTAVAESQPEEEPEETPPSQEEIPEAAELVSPASTDTDEPSLIPEVSEEPFSGETDQTFTPEIEPKTEPEDAGAAEETQVEIASEIESADVLDKEQEDSITSSPEESIKDTDELLPQEDLQGPEEIAVETDELVEAVQQQNIEESETQAEDTEEIAPVITLDDSKAKPKIKKRSLFSRLADRLSRTRESFTYQLDTLFLGKKEIDTDLLDDLEELLITADLGVSTTQEILDHARRKVKRNELDDPQSLKLAIQDKIKSFISDYQEDAALVMPEEGPFVIMVVGVNGVGKTTTIGKITHKFIRSGQSVLLVAADTFRAAAISQLKIWGERNNVPVAAQDEGSDPSSVVYDAIAHAKAKKYDVVIVDTAGRLHTQANLMEELKKIKRVMAKQLEGAPHEVMLIVDATTGQNGISQAKLFNEAVNVTGITLTKLDGTAKGGIVANICKELKTPIRFIGIGETIDDLRDFDTDEFIEALFQSRTSGEPE